MKDILRYSHPLCFSVAYCESECFRHQAFKVKEDSQFILRLISKKDKKNLDFMEQFYKTLIQEGFKDSQKDIHSRNNPRLLPLSATGEVEEGFNNILKEFEEIKIKRRENKQHH